MGRLETLLTAILALATLPAAAQRFSLGIDGARVLSLGTLNADASVALSQRISLHAGAALNPWTFHAGDADRQAQLRQFSCWGGLRWWPWHVYSGWWAGTDGAYLLYNAGGGILPRETEEGDAFAGRLLGGYSVMLSENWNLDIGVGVLGGWKQFTRYNCPSCGAIVDQGEKAFLLPDARVALQLIF